ncbi:spore coat protein Y [Halobacillus andaensis]|uniref:Spore coat protein Y n=1 Tax=Halobacillus andaensis TaxID=1176239 RepID=A0A917B2A6_HALAA|nr:CotY/CotZ family spore coat protein [Halobacillus andaensis]MBP2004034.1 spore coat protein Z [Halobacillus andaensis]GGF15289.1 spore coat protein Y [Halobacillus andaensis]
MSCGKHHDSGNCVCDILSEIVAAQNDVLSDCNTSCEQSIGDLLGDTGGSGRDTVPVLLYCKGNCKPFKGFGARRDSIKDIKGSFYFRVKDVDKDCCATLELLRDPEDKNEDPNSPVEQKTGNLKATGICISVDLDCFCHVTCLPAITALS